MALLSLPLIVTVLTSYRRNVADRTSQLTCPVCDVRIQFLPASISVGTGLAGSTAVADPAQVDSVVAETCRRGRVAHRCRSAGSVTLCLSGGVLASEPVAASASSWTLHVAEPVAGSQPAE